jgi:hypothetical protein
MKKLFPLFLSVVMIFSACACGGKSKNVSFTPKISGSFSMSAEIINDDTQAEALITRYGTDNWDVEFSSPNTLAGVLLSYRDDNVEASYKGLSFSVPKSALPLKAMISNLIYAVDSMSELSEIECQEDDGKMLYEGESEQGKYTLSFNNDGSLYKFAMPNYKLEMTFADFSEGSSEIETTANEETESISSKPSETVNAEE